MDNVVDVWKRSRQVQKAKELQMQDDLEKKQDADDGVRVAASTLDDSGGFGRKLKGRLKAKGKSAATKKLNLQVNSPRKKYLKQGLGSASTVSSATIGTASVARLTQVGQQQPSRLSSEAEAGSDIENTPIKPAASRTLTVLSGSPSNGSKRSGSFVGGASVGGSVVGLDSFGAGDCQYVVPQEVLDFTGDILHHPTIILKGFPPLRQVRKVGPCQNCRDRLEF